jgi:beta-phosphoglucomutase-like phosphatase (HAD superfamily)
VVEYLDGAAALGLKLAVASSSRHDWVDAYLSRLGLLDRFDAILCADDVTRTKPDPELYAAAVYRLGVETAAAIAIEDSPNGLRAARAAGLFCVATPNPMTALLPLDEADVVVASLSDLPLPELLARATPRTP